MSAIDLTTQRAEEIREATGCPWEIACQRAEMERDGYRPDPESAMPAKLQWRHHALLMSASECYERRNADSDRERAIFWHDTGDLYFARALALSAEWHA